MSPPPSQEGPAAAQRLRPHPRGGEEAPICPSFWWSRGMCVADKHVGCAAPPAVTGHPHRALAPGSHPRPSPTLTLSKGSRPPHRKRLSLLSHPLPWRPAGSATMDGIPSPRHCPHSKGHQKPRGLLRAQLGPSVSVAPSLMPPGFSAAHRPPSPQALAQILDFVPPQEAGAVKTWVQFLPCPPGPWHLGQDASWIKGGG